MVSAGYNVPVSGVLFFFLEKLNIIAIDFHNIDMRTTWYLPTTRVIPGTVSAFGGFCHTWRPIKK